MDELLSTLITGAPNLIVALAAIYWLSKRMDKMLDLLILLAKRELCDDDQSFIDGQPDG